MLTSYRVNITNTLLGYKMKIAINFSTLKSGGGQNVALNFLHAQSKIINHKNRYTYFVANNSQVYEFVKKNAGFKYILFPENPLIRILFEFFYVSFYLRFNKYDVIYSYFGFSFNISGVRQVSGSADSNLYFPEIDFWRDYKGIDRIKKYIIDWYRILGLKLSDGVVFENPALEVRGKKLFNLRNTITINPSISCDFPWANFEYEKKTKYVGLFLCGWHLNKNVLMIPSLVRCARDCGLDFSVVITAKPSGDVYKKFLALAEENNVINYIDVCGPIVKDNLRGLYSGVDFVFLMSKLESFSNNIIEAWYFKKPLVVSDEEWSRSICGDSAIYVNRDSAADVVKSIIDAIDDGVIDKIVDAGARRINDYPTIEERIRLEIDFLERII